MLSHINLSYLLILTTTLQLFFSLQLYLLFPCLFVFAETLHLPKVSLWSWMAAPIRESYQWLPLRNMTSPPTGTADCRLLLRECLRLHEPILLPGQTVGWLSLWQVCEGSCRCCELMGTAALYSSEDRFPQHPSRPWIVVFLPPSCVIF